MGDKPDRAMTKNKNLLTLEKSMKKLSLLAAALLAGLVSVSAQAVTANFDVTITLTSACEITTVPSVDFAYTSFQTGISTANSVAGNVRCTNALPYSVALDALTTTDNATNLTYTLALGAIAGTGAGVLPQPIVVTGTMAPGQAGTCATATCTNAAATNKTRTLTITY